MAKFSKKWTRFIFYGAAAGIGTLVAVAAAKKKGKKIKKNGSKLVKKAKNKLKSTRDNLSQRQQRILSLFDREERITNDMISSVIPNVTDRTIRRDLTDLEKKGYIKKVGKTKGSYYILK